MVATMSILVDATVVSNFAAIQQLESQVEVGFYQKIPSKLHRGEAISLAIAKYRHWLFLTDDKGARRFAKQNGIAVSGTLGVLIGLIEGEIVTLLEANEMLAGMITLARYQSPITDLGLLLAD
jgi:predicted nucleic acid-binding protein